jgi:hypothetical protein
MAKPAPFGRGDSVAQSTYPRLKCQQTLKFAKPCKRAAGATENARFEVLRRKATVRVDCRVGWAYMIYHGESIEGASMWCRLQGLAIKNSAARRYLRRESVRSVVITRAFRGARLPFFWV